MSQPQTQEPQGNPSQQPTQQQSDPQQTQSQSPQQTQSQTPQTTPEPRQHNNPSSGPGQAILDALNALPEKIVNGLREAMPTAPQQPQTTSHGKQQSSDDSGNTSQSKESTQKISPTSAPKAEPGNPQALSRQQRFAKWWMEG